MAIFHAEPNCSLSERRSLTNSLWRVAPLVEEVADHLHPSIAQLLASRGVVTTDEVEAFMQAELSSLHNPLLLPDMAAAAGALKEALERNAHIRIFGDYDTDGITATALLVRALSSLNGKVDWYLPHRVDDGYGLNIPALDKALDDGVELGITVDNGIVAHEQLAYAKSIGLRMIVTDHHEPDGELPPAVAVVNPKRADSAYPFRELAGVGVAFALLRALCTELGLPPAAPMRFLDLVTMGTVADVVPLIGENRLLVRHGLPMMTQLSKKVGISALLNSIGTRERASCSDIAFQIAPRLNAAGRIAHADEALRLLLTGDHAEAEKLADNLSKNNTERQREELHTIDEAIMQVEGRDLASEKALVLTSANWHPGVIGIVASRLLERFYRPSILISVQDGIGKGSARARSPFHLWKALDECSHLLRRFGGHRAAAGFEVDEDNIPALREALCAIADRELSDTDLMRTLDIDAWLDLKDVTTAFAREVESLAPFGMGNPTPVFAASDVLVQQCSSRGADSSHFSLSLCSGPGARPIPAIWFRCGDQSKSIHIGDRIDIAFNVGLNTWQGLTSAQLVVKDVMV